MGYFSEALRLFLSERNLTQDELSAASGIERSLISRLLRDKVPSRAQLASICAAVSPDTNDRVLLLQAHLIDEALPVLQSADLLDWKVTMAKKTGHDSAVDTGVASEKLDGISALPKKLQEDLELIAAESMQLIELREVIKQWALLIRRYREKTKEKKGISARRPHRTQPNEATEISSTFRRGMSCGRAA